MQAGAAAADPARAIRHRRAVERAEISGRAALEATVLRLRSLEALDVALSLATSGRSSDYHVWSERVVADASVGRAIGDDLDPHWAATLAQILARSILDQSAELVALAVYRELAARSGPAMFEPRDAQVYGQLLLQFGGYDALRASLPHLELRPVIRRMLLTDLERLDVVEGRRPLAAWSAAMQELMQVGSLGFELPSHTEPFRFDELHSRADSEPVDGPLITVVMPAFAPDAGLVTAVHSILAQTWQHLEVLIVDDASPPVTRHLFAEVAALDARVRVISKPRNGGTYSARNTALTAARGEFITGQDADDWSHPERLERQVRPLLEDRSLVATLSRCLRVTDDLRTSSLRASGSSPTRMNSSSLMFRRTEVMHRIGYYDRVRKGADSEFIVRMGTVFGKRAVRELPECLALVRLVTGSLSRADFLPGWQHESRVWYRELYTHWHRRISRGDDPFLAIDRRERPFPAPASFVSGEGSPLGIDELFVADLRDLGAAQERLLGIARQLSAQGRRVGLAHLERFEALDPARRGPHPTILDAVLDGDVTFVEWSREVSAEHLIIWPAELPEFHGERQSSWKAERVGLVVEDAMPLSDVPASLLRWEASAEWVRRNLGVDTGIGLLAPGAHDPAVSELGRGASRALPEVGRIGPAADRLEAVLVVPEGQGVPESHLGPIVDAIDQQRTPLRVAGLNGMGDIVAQSRVIEVDGRPLQPWVASGAGEIAAVYIAIGARRSGSSTPHGGQGVSGFPAPSYAPDDEQEGGPSGHLLPMPGPVTSPPSLDGAGRQRPVPSEPVGRAEQRARITLPVPFVAVAGGVDVSGVCGWSSYTLAGVQYWFPSEGAVVVIPTALAHRLSRPSCTIAIRRTSGEAGAGPDPWDEWSRSGIADPSAALMALADGRAPSALAVHDSHRWTVHCTDPAALTCLRDRRGRLCAVATEEPALMAFLAALHDTTPTDAVRPDQGDAVSRLIHGERDPATRGLFQGNAVAFSALHGHAFVALAELEPGRVS
jgi:hypothetical protein